MLQASCLCSKYTAWWGKMQGEPEDAGCDLFFWGQQEEQEGRPQGAPPVHSATPALTMNEQFPFPHVPGKRQVPFNAVETLLCYGLFSLIDPHHYGGGNIDRIPASARILSIFFRRTPGSITSKMLNLDGSRHMALVRNLFYSPISLRSRSNIWIFTDKLWL